MSNDIETLLEEYGFLDEDGYLLPPDDPVIEESMERFAELRSIADHNEADLNTEERLELQELHDLHTYYLDQLNEYEKEEYPSGKKLNGKSLRDFLLNGELEDSDENDDDYEDDCEEESDDYEDESDDDYEE